jgi:prepilin-type N-terminal cleavage/methylation domain-containing protein
MKNISIKSKGFTLIEIIVVIAIMGILTAIIYSSFDSSRATSRDQKRVSDISAIQLALEQYFQQNGVYPMQLSALVPTYIASIPIPPNNSESPYQNNYFPMAKVPGPDNSHLCVSYQLWTKFELNNAYLNSKKGFDSTLVADSKGLKTFDGFYECVSPGNNHYGAQIDANASTSPNPAAAELVYDVMP